MRVGYFFHFVVSKHPESTHTLSNNKEHIHTHSSANKFFAVLRRNRSDPLSRAMGCIGDLRASSRSAGYERFGTGNLAPLAVLGLYSSPSPSLQPILREPATSILIVVYTFECIMWVATESLWRYVQATSELHQPRLWFITGGYLVKRWFITAAARARGQSKDWNR